MPEKRVGSFTMGICCCLLSACWPISPPTVLVGPLLLLCTARYVALPFPACSSTCVHLPSPAGLCAPQGVCGNGHHPGWRLGRACHRAVERCQGGARPGGGLDGPVAAGRSGNAGLQVAYAFAWKSLQDSHCGCLHIPAGVGINFHSTHVSMSVQNQQVYTSALAQKNLIENTMGKVSGACCLLVCEHVQSAVSAVCSCDTVAQEHERDQSTSSVSFSPCVVWAGAPWAAPQLIYCVTQIAEVAFCLPRSCCTSAPRAAPFSVAPDLRY